MDTLLRVGGGLFPPMRRLLAERDALRRERDEALRERDEAVRLAEGVRPYVRFVPLGHFHSPLPSAEEVAAASERLFGPPQTRNLPGVDLNERGQVALLRELQPFYDELPFPERPTEGFRYSFDNAAHSWSDAIFFYAMIRRLRPRRIVEVGAGHSTCLILDTSERFFEGAIDLWCIDPYPGLVRALVGADDRDRFLLLEQPLQDVELDLFRSLGPNDILFVDSTHVSKFGSDVNHLFFEILPLLEPGVHVSFQGVFYPFEYPVSWVEAGRAWNEAYLLRAFLQYNQAWEVVLSNTYLEHFHREWFERHMPLCLRNLGGSFWIRRRETPAEPRSASR